MQLMDCGIELTNRLTHDERAIPVLHGIQSGGTYADTGCAARNQHCIDARLL
jgi:hypothetical protein